jgi:hypothetical protein
MKTNGILKMIELHSDKKLSKRYIYYQNLLKIRKNEVKKEIESLKAELNTISLTK